MSSRFITNLIALIIIPLSLYVVFKQSLDPLLEKFLTTKKDTPLTEIDPTFKRPPREFSGIYFEGNYWVEWFGERPESKWIKAEKDLYKNLLNKDIYDVMVVPFQSFERATDSISRSLMTKFLVEEIRKNTNSRIPDPDQLAIALGINLRIYPREELFKLAHDLGVKIIIEGHAGFKDRYVRKKGISVISELSLVVNVFNLDTSTKRDDLYILSHHFEWNNLPLDHIHLPYMEFTKIMPELMAKLQLPIHPVKTRTLNSEVKKSSNIPLSLEDLLHSSSGDYLTDVYILQFIASLYPDPFDRRREQLFERSLVSLADIGTENPDYKLLKTRALLYLHRRPAAIQVLGEPESAGEKFLYGLMNGNYPQMKDVLSKIDNQIIRLISSLELMQMEYEYFSSYKDDVDNFVKYYGEWEYFLSRVIHEPDNWKLFSNYELKRNLDNLFPLPGYSVENIDIGNYLILKTPHSEVDYAKHVIEHVRNVILKQFNSGNQKENNWAISEIDILILFQAIAEANILKTIKFHLDTQGKPTDSMQFIGLTTSFFDGHPDIAALRAKTNHQLSNLAGGQEKENRLDAVVEDCRLSKLWSNGQTQYTSLSDDILTELGKKRSDMFFGIDILFDNDFPRRFYYGDDYQFAEYGPHEYTYDKAWVLFMVAKNIYQSSGKEEAKKFLDKHQNRFVGSSKVVGYKAELYKIMGEEMTDQLATLEEGQSENWHLYFALAKKQLENGNVKKALEIYLSYPPFNGESHLSNVHLSNVAAQAGESLYWNGAYEEAKQLYQKCADYGTGSGGHILALRRLAILDGNFMEAATQSLSMANRYNILPAYGEYISLLHAFGLYKEAWSVFHQFTHANDKELWSSALVGHRIAGNSREEITAWLMNDMNFIGEIRLFNRLSYLQWTLLIDREPDDFILSYLNKLNEHDENEPSPIGSYSILSIMAYIALKKGEYEKAYNLMKEMNKEISEFQPIEESIQLESHFPYFIWAALKSNKETDVDRYFKDTSIEHMWRKYYMTLADAFRAGWRDQHEVAISSLKKAYYLLPDRHFHQWYKLMEACEWLYEDSQFEPYKQLLIYWAIDYQVIQPWNSLGYAIEAKYSGDKERRLQALAYTLFLDRKSIHINGISDEEKQEALIWLEKNNKFRKPEDAGEKLST